MNANRLEQDHPCVVETIRRHFVHPPAERDVPYFLTYPEKKDPSGVEGFKILDRLGDPV